MRTRFFASGGRRWIGAAVLTAAVIATLNARASADTFTPLASYEPSETDLTFQAGPNDPGLQIARVEGGVGGAPAATDGSYVLRLQFTDEIDNKIEFRQIWSEHRYDLAGKDQLLADVYIASAGALPVVMGIYDPNWAPPDAWQVATGFPSVGVWTTISFDLQNRSQTDLDEIRAFVFDYLAGTSGIAYVDNLRFRACTPTTGVAANGYADHVRLVWKASTGQGFQGYNVYGALSADGPFTKLNAALLPDTGYDDVVGVGYPRYYYRVTAMVNEQETDVGSVVSALYDGLTDEELLDLVQQASFRYFWDGAHPACGMAREGIGTEHGPNTVTTGGTGMGLINIVVGVERGFITRAEAAERTRVVLRFLDGNDPQDPNLPSHVQRYHGAWAHQYNGVTGETIAFAAPEDNGGDLVETAFLMEGVLIDRQYFNDPTDAVETEIRARATEMWQGVEWSFYQRYPNSDVLYWHWSPNYEWAMNHEIRGFNEAMIVYLLAIASPAYPMPASSYYNGWAGRADYANHDSYYGYPIWVGPPYGGPLFRTQYSYLGFDPRYKRDAYADYFESARNISLVNQAYCIDNPGGYPFYDEFSWGLTACRDPWAQWHYAEHSPTSDNGTIAPTATLSAMPYVPDASITTLRHLYDLHGTSLWGPYGFRDAFNACWFDPGYLAIDQGPIAPMIENYRTGRCWELFMSNPEIARMLRAIGFDYEVDYDADGYVGIDDWETFATCFAGPSPSPPPGCTLDQSDHSDLDNDGDVDLVDVAIFQRLFDDVRPGDLNCDGSVDFGDINPFVLYLSNNASWQLAFPGCNPLNGDINDDGSYGQSSFGDINPFVALLVGG